MESLVGIPDGDCKSRKVSTRRKQDQKKKILPVLANPLPAGSSHNEMGKVDLTGPAKLRSKREKSTPSI